MQKIDKVTVIGANGTMGQNIAAIFASFGNAEVYLVSRINFFLKLGISLCARCKYC